VGGRGGGGSTRREVGKEDTRSEKRRPPKKKRVRGPEDSKPFESTVRAAAPRLRRLSKS
jgi:hypothetical protein